MVRFFLAAVTIVALVGLDAAEARGKPGGRRHRGDRAGILAAVDLSDAQREQLRALHKDHRAQMAELKESGEISREAVRELREGRRLAVGEILTDEQRAAIDQVRSERQAQREGRKGRGGLLRELDFSDEQKEQLRALRTELGRLMKELKASDDVSKEQIGALHEQYRAAFQEILSGEQRAQLDALRAQREEEGGKLGRGHRRPWGRGGPGSADAEGGDTAPAEAAITVDGAGDAATAVEQRTWGKVKEEASD